MHSLYKVLGNRFSKHANRLHYANDFCYFFLPIFPCKRCKATISSLSYNANCVIIAIIRQIIKAN